MSDFGDTDLQEKNKDIIKKINIRFIAPPEDVLDFTIINQY